jgi:hypothetical protein
MHTHLSLLTKVSKNEGYHFAQYFSKVLEDCGELGIHAFSVDRVEFGGSTTLGKA